MLDLHLRALYIQFTFLALYSVIRGVQEFKLLFGIFNGFGSA
jgi:hypothetical protein